MVPDKPNTWLSMEQANTTPPPASSGPPKDAVKVADNVVIKLVAPDGTVKHSSAHNTVTTKGKEGAAAQCATTPAVGKPTHMAIGTGSPAANALGTELDRNALTSSTSSGAVLTMVSTWAPGDGTGAITEAGTFDAGAAGNMWTSVSFAVVNKAAGDTLTITWTLTFA